MEENFSQLVEEKSIYVSKGNRKIGRKQYTSLQKTFNVISSGGIFPKYNYIFRIDTIKYVLLMQHTHEIIQLKAGRLRNVTIAGNKFNNIPVY